MRHINAEDIFKTILTDTPDEIDPDASLAATDKTMLSDTNNVYIVSLKKGPKGAARKKKKDDGHRRDRRERPLH